VRVRAWALPIICGALLVALPATRAAAVAPCWEQVIADWSDNGRVDRTYPLSCYRAAVQRMPEDLRAYSSAPAAIDRALAARRVDRPASLASAALLTPAAAGAPRMGTRLATVVPPLAGVLVAAGVGWWLLRARRRPSDDS
jgi:hypothetical protein